MLVLTRKVGESIAIGSDVHIHILRAKGGLVKIGVDAPRDVQISREGKLESLLVKDSENQGKDNAF